MYSIHFLCFSTFSSLCVSGSPGMRVAVTTVMIYEKGFNLTGWIIHLSF